MTHPLKLLARRAGGLVEEPICRVTRCQGWAGWLLALGWSLEPPPLVTAELARLSPVSPFVIRSITLVSASVACELTCALASSRVSTALSVANRRVLFAAS